MARIELGRAQLWMAFKVQAARPHEIKRFRNPVSEFCVTARLHRSFTNPSIH